ncbi:hypothetical protein EVAR_47940_1 [Eumeta japonica]|uniref:Uncharacterized protein n=1 Tax=Eumeta variegata TaxID=151549 RepID=A0A4C1Y7N1_EUMVA|nr:hypothetical protein EVAR_47940_1 [Eumeta japonica]
MRLLLERSTSKNPFRSFPGVAAGAHDAPRSNTSKITNVSTKTDFIVASDFEQHVPSDNTRAKTLSQLLTCVLYNRFKKSVRGCIDIADESREGLSLSSDEQRVDLHKEWNGIDLKRTPPRASPGQSHRFWGRGQNSVSSDEIRHPSHLVSRRGETRTAEVPFGILSVCVDDRIDDICELMKSRRGGNLCVNETTGNE